MSLPEDIVRKINKDFPSNSDQEKVTQLFHQLHKASLNVGYAQLARAILVLVDGDVNQIEEIIKNDYHGDPRDVIMLAEAKLGFPNDYFISPFSD